MFKRVVSAIRAHRSPILCTAVSGERMGAMAVLDDHSYGEADLLPSPRALPEELPALMGDVLIERITTTPHLILCGGGHVAVQTAKIAKMIGFFVTVVDDRADFANRDRFPSADQILVMPYQEALSALSTDNAYFVIVTRGHRDDRACLEQILRKGFTYCGMIGSRTKVKLLFDELVRQGFDKATLDRVHSPIGLSIGANTPEEIAVCIAAELIQVKNGLSHGVEWDEALLRAVESPKSRYAVCTIISKRGSAPRSTGARMIVYPDGSTVSSVGGGFGEYEATQYALSMLKNGPSVKRYTCNMTNQDAAEAGMVCGGTIDILIQIREA